MFRPEYLLVGGAFVVLAAIRVGAGARLAAGPGRRRRCCVAALLLPIVPWTIRNVDRPRPRRCRSRPAAARRSTSAPTCPPTANTSGSRRCWSSATEHRDLAPDSEALERGRPDAALRPRRRPATPTCPRDSALGKIGKENFSKYFGEDPVGYLAMTARKVGRMWSSGVGEAMSSGAGRAVQILLVALGLAGLVRARALAPPLVGAGRAGDADRARHRGRRGLAGGPAAQRGADDAGLSACRRGPVAGRSRPYPPRLMVPLAGIFPAELTALRSAGLLIARRARRLRGRCAAARCATSTC